MNCLSLFDGISCGNLAFQRAGIVIDKYYASEINKDAINVALNNFPEIIQLGDVRTINKQSVNNSIDIIIGGSPCQGFSYIGKGLNFTDPRSALFFEYARILKEFNPKYFLLENVMMKKEYSDTISEYLGVHPIMINSNLFSAQNRKRLYWTNIDFPIDIIDKQIVLDDVIDLNYCSYTIPKNWEKYVPSYLPNYCDPYHRKEITNKSTTLRTNVNNGNMWVKVQEGYRNLSRSEAEMLQTVPIGYTSSISENKAKRALGNAWTVDVIAHIFKHIS